MFDLQRNILIQTGIESPITRWEVWFVTPKGLANDLETAIRVCDYNDWDINAVLRPVPVAIDKLDRYEIISRG